MSNQDILSKIDNKEVNIAIFGLGRVGLPLATVFSNCGVKIFGIENNSEKLNLMKSSKCPFFDPELQKNLDDATRTNNFQIFNSLDDVNTSIDIFMICVGTPTLSSYTLDYSQMKSALGQIHADKLKGKMLIIRSTLPPNTTNDFILPFIENNTGLTSGVDFNLAICPERILEGKAIQELHDLPEIIGGINQESNTIATHLFKLINDLKDILYVTPLGAEFAKLFANIYRYVNFALANEFAIWAENYGLDATELIKAVNYNYSRSNIPKPGFVGGPCLSKDSMFLDFNTTFSSILSASLKINESIPNHIVNNVKTLDGNLFNKKIAVLGLSFKAGSDDLRNSPSVKLVDTLHSTGADVFVHDPYVKETESLDKVIQDSDIVIILLKVSASNVFCQVFNEILFRYFL